MQRLATALLVLLVAASAAPTASVATTDSVGTTASVATTDSAESAAVGEPTRDPAATDRTGNRSYAGTHVSFDADDRAVTDYAVDGETVLDALRVASRERVEDSEPVGADASPSAATELDGSGLNLSATTESEARITAESGATMAAHDNRRGVLVVASGDRTHYAVADLPANASAEAESDAAVEVTTENGTEATAFVVGEGSVAVTDEGDVAARLGEDARLAVRSYSDGKDDADGERERLLAEGAASAEVYVTTEGGNASGGENATGTENATASANASERAVVDAVTYDADTTVAVDRVREGEVALAVNRTTDEGTVLLASVSPDLLDAGEVTVTVDGEAATEAATYSQLEGAVDSEQSRYVVGEGANASTEVGVGITHFSERAVAVTSPESADEETTSDGTTVGETANDGATTGDPASDGRPTAREDDDGEENDGGENDGGVPGFTPAIAVVGLLAAVVAGVVLTRVR